MESAVLNGAFFGVGKRQGLPNWEQVTAQSVHDSQFRAVGANLQAADLAFADLRGADLNGAKLQGASLHDADLRGADLRGAELQGASLYNAKLDFASLAYAKVWRVSGDLEVHQTDFAGCDPYTLPFIDLLETIELEGGVRLPDLPIRTLSAEFKNWADKVLATIPEGDSRERAKERLSVLGEDEQGLFGPPLPSQEMAEATFWIKACAGQPEDKERERQLATFLADLVCSAPSPPFVARGVLLSRRIESPIVAPFISDRMLKGKSNSVENCPGVEGFNDDDWAKVYDLSRIRPNDGAGD